MPIDYERSLDSCRFYLASPSTLKASRNIEILSMLSGLLSSKGMTMGLAFATPIGSEVILERKIDLAEIIKIASKILLSRTQLVKYIKSIPILYKLIGAARSLENHVEFFTSILKLTPIKSITIGIKFSALFKLEDVSTRIIRIRKILSSLIKTLLLRTEIVWYRRYYYKLSLAPHEQSFILVSYTPPSTNDVDFYLFIPNYLGIPEKLLADIDRRINIRKIISIIAKTALLRYFNVGFMRQFITPIILSNLYDMMFNLIRKINLITVIRMTKFMSLSKRFLSQIELPTLLNRLINLNRSSQISFIIKGVLYRKFNDIEVVISNMMNLILHLHPDKTKNPIKVSYIIVTTLAKQVNWRQVERPIIKLLITALYYMHKHRGMKWLRFREYVRKDYR